ncbi:MAG: HTTM domain-containing protein [Haloarculaceae archaeon]
MTALLRRRIHIDTRALAMLRMALGLLLVADVVARAPDLVAFYTDTGVVPRSALAEIAPTFGSLSIHALWGTALPQAILFLLAGLAAVALLVGYRTRVATLVSLVLLISLHARNPAILNGGDTLLRHLLVWGVFLPLGERWSVDAVRRDHERDRIASLATAGLLAQVVLVYGTNAVLKLRGDIWLAGDAVEQALMLTRYSTPIGAAILEFPLLPMIADYLWLGLLLASPLLLVTTGTARVVLVGAFAAMHAGMALSMGLGLFPYISIAALVPFVPSHIWNRVPDPPTPVFTYIDTALPRPGRPSTMLWDIFSPLVRPAAGLLLVGMVVVNAASIGLVEYPQATPDAVEDKSWSMFAPRPPSDDGWYVASALLDSGDRMDLLRGSRLSWDRPPDVDNTYPNNRWQKLLYQLRGRPEVALQRPLARYLCRQWNQRHLTDAISIRLVYVEYPTDRPGRGDRLQLTRLSCPTPTADAMHADDTSRGPPA